MREAAGGDHDWLGYGIRHDGERWVLWAEAQSPDGEAVHFAGSLEGELLSQLHMECMAVAGGPTLDPDEIDKFRLLRAVLTEVADAIGEAIQRGKRFRDTGPSR